VRGSRFPFPGSRFPFPGSRFPVPGSRFCALAIVLLAAVPAGAQGRFTNARTETRAAGQGSDAIGREVRAVASRGGAAWIGYRVAMNNPTGAARHMCCYDSFNDANACCGMCRLENGGGITMTTGDVQSRGTRITLEPPTEFLILARVENGAVMRVRTFTPDCDVDAGNMPVVWLTDVRPDDSVAWLSDLIKAAGADRERTNRVGDPALAALSMHTAPAALTALIRFAKESESTRLRGQALFWLAQRAGEQAASTITTAIADDPDTDVKKRAVFALSQLPKDEGIPKLIEVARTNRNPAVRKQAYFWLGQTNDPRATAFFEEILSRK
jgi:HEAT repeats